MKRALPGLFLTLTLTAVAADEEGLASWYGEPYHGRVAASGEIYDMEEMTAAHRTLPFGTTVRVHRVDTGGNVVVRINDRGPIPEDVTHALRRVESESARMSVLVDELLLLARLDAGRPLEQEPVDLTRLTIEVTSDARVAGPTHRWQLKLPDEPLLVRGDELRLRQVIGNLLSNAAKHTPADSTITVAVAGTRSGPGADHRPAAGNGAANRASGPANRAGGASGAGAGPEGVRLSVTDNGQGIPPDLVPELFARFARGDSSRSRAAGSTGLGLAIVKAVVAAHHGTVGVQSRPGQTTFSIVLPRLAEPPEEGQAPPSGPAGGHAAPG